MPRTFTFLFIVAAIAVGILLIGSIAYTIRMPPATRPATTQSAPHR